MLTHATRSSTPGNSRRSKANTTLFEKGSGGVSLAKVEAFLARLYVNEKSRDKFLVDPLLEAKRAGLSAEESQALENLDRVGLELLATSLERKKQRLRTSNSGFRR
jgi:hypothetical protein